MTLDQCKAKAKAEHAKLEVRQEGGTFVYSCAGKDLMTHTPGANVYTLKRNFPKYDGYVAGARKTIGEPVDEQIICTARDLANEIAP